jgi:hypothetical protein
LPQLNHLFDDVRQKFVVVQSRSFLGLLDALCAAWTAI